jgi:hypothetical protein
MICIEPSGFVGLPSMAWHDGGWVLWVAAVLYESVPLGLFRQWSLLVGNEFSLC